MRIWTRKSALIQPRTSLGKSDGVLARPSRGELHLGGADRPRRPRLKARGGRGGRAGPGAARGRARAASREE